MNVNIVNGFSNRPDGGNPAGVVLLETKEQENAVLENHALKNGIGVTDEEMQQIAAKLGFSETAFIKPLGEGRFYIRYFTPAAEVPLCGHATIASFFYLYKKGIIGNGVYKLVTTQAELDIEVTDGIVWMEMDAPSMEEPLDEKIIQRLCEAYEICRTDLDEGLEPRIVTSGLRDIHLIVKNRDVLMKARQQEEAVVELSKELDVVGVHMSCFADSMLETFAGRLTDYTSNREEITAYCSNFAPLYEIPEECATGTSNAGLTYYLYQKGLIKPDKTNCFLQGEHMSRPSKVYTKVLAEGDVPKIWVGGTGVICEEGIVV